MSKWLGEGHHTHPACATYSSHPHVSDWNGCILADAIDHTISRDLEKPPDLAVPCVKSAALKEDGKGIVVKLSHH